MVRVETKLPTVFVMRSVIGAIIFFGLPLYAWFNKPAFVTDRQNYQPWLIVVGVLIAISLFDLYVRKGYSVWYNDDSIYWRKVGLSRGPASVVAVPFSEISDVRCLSEERGSEAFGLISSNADVPEIILSADYIRDYNLVPLLAKVASLSHANFDDGAARFMQAG